MVAGENPEAQHVPMSTERIEEQSVSPQPESLTRPSLLARLKNLFKGLVEDVGSGRPQKDLNPFSRTLPPQEPPSPNVSEPSKP